jgi:hypothetical protein
MKKLFEAIKNSSHPGGTYSALIPSRESQEELFSFVAGLDVDNLEDSDEYHCTLIYSSTPCPDIVKEDFALPCEAIPIQFKILGTDKAVLVLEVYCPNAARLHDLFMEKHGATHDFPEYIAHITVAKDFEGEVPADVPEFNIEFTGMMVEELG